MINKKNQRIITILTLILSLVGFAWYNYNIYQEVRKLVYEKVDEQLLIAAKTTKLLLPSDFHTRAKNQNAISQKEDEKNIAILSELVKISNVEYVYTMIRQNDTIYFTSSSATEEERQTGDLLTRYFDTYADSDAEVKKVFIEQKLSYSESTDAWGTHRAVAIPYEAEDGSLYIVGADIEINLFHTMLKEATTKNILLGLILLFSGLPMFIWSFKKSQMELMSLVEHDPLTKLFNRRGLSERLHKAIASCKKRANYGAILFIDIDHFKDVNDSKGHTVGDLVLIEVSKRLLNHTHTEDTIARFGGDEFVILIEDLGDEKKECITAVTEVANTILTALSEKLTIHGHHFKITGSMGISLFTADASADNMLRYADTAMYTAKESGRNTIKFFDSNIQRMVEDKLALVNSLQKALEEEDPNLFCQYQIQVDQNEKIIGVESLLRWNDPVHGSISPSDFIPLAEKSDLILDLSAFVLTQTMQLLKTWEEDPIKQNWRISVNISMVQLEHGSFVEEIEGMIKRFNCNPKLLRFELTESVLMKNPKKVLLIIQRLSTYGITFSIDDFGTGYSSLAYFKQLTLHELKIDKSFVDDILSDVNDRKIVETIITFGRQLDLKVIAEGVESKAQHEMLRSLGCHYFQGYYFAKPVNAEFL